MEEFNDKWKLADFIWKVDRDSVSIIKINNPKTREVYEDMYYRNLYFFSLAEAKKFIKKIYKPVTPEGHFVGGKKLSEYKVVIS